MAARGGGKVTGKASLRFIYASWVFLCCLLAIFLLRGSDLQKLIFLQTAYNLPSCPIFLKASPLPTDASFYNSSVKLPLPKNPTVHEAFANKILYWDNITVPAPRGLHTRIEENQNYKRFGLTSLTDVCLRPDGKLLVVGASADEILRSVEAAGPATAEEWKQTYNCSFGCAGVEMLDETPDDALWMSGNTTHIIPYLGNVFHHFGDRVWPHIAGSQFPLNETTMKPVNHFLVHNMEAWLRQAHENVDRDTLMFQVRILGQLWPQSDYLQHAEHETRPLCFQRLTLACVTCDRVSRNLGPDIYVPALLKYREAALAFFGIPEPEVPLPPQPLRVTLYGRNDTSRRRVPNILDVTDHLRSWAGPPLQVTLVDELLASGAYRQSLPEVVSLMSRTDIFITVHGANTWASIFLPKRAAVIEIHGPCGPFSWLHTIVEALKLKHETKDNPWADAIPSPLAGNTTKCESPQRTPDFTIDIQKLDSIMNSLALPQGSGDRLPLHWLYNWATHSY